MKTGFLDFLVYILVSVITPGPNTIMSMRNGTVCGFRRGIRFNIGAFLGFTVLMTLCLFLSRTVLALVPRIKPFLSAAGACYILWQAYTCLRAGKLEDSGSDRKTSILQGFLFQFTNAKAAIFGITALTNYVISRTDSLPIQLLSCVFLASIAFFCAVLWLGLGSVMKELLSRYNKIVRIIMAGMLVFVAVRLILP